MQSATNPRLAITLTARMRKLTFVLRSTLGLALTVGLAQCTVTPLGATDAGVARARRATPLGGDLFERQCAPCHGSRGEGLTIAPAVMGTGALAEYGRDDASSSSPVYAPSAQIQNESARVPGRLKRGPFHTAQDVYGYVSTRMPLPTSRAGSLGPDAYLAIVNYILIAHGLAVPAGGVTAANARSVELH